MRRLNLPVIAAAAIALTTAATANPAAAQQAGPTDVSANVTVNSAAATLPKGLGCKLHITNPRLCVTSSAASPKPQGRRPTGNGSVRPRR